MPNQIIQNINNRFPPNEISGATMNHDQVTQSQTTTEHLQENSTTYAVKINSNKESEPPDNKHCDSIPPRGFTINYINHLTKHMRKTNISHHQNYSIWQKEDAKRDSEDRKELENRNLQTPIPNDSTQPNISGASPITLTPNTTKTQVLDTLSVTFHNQMISVYTFKTLMELIKMGNIMIITYLSKSSKNGMPM